MEKSRAFFIPRLPVFLPACLLLFTLGTACNNGGKADKASGEAGTENASSSTASVPMISYGIAATEPHDTSFFTEGLEFYHNTLLESTGLPGKSRLVQVDLSTGKLLKQVILDPRYFGEGITVLHDTLYQLTWREHIVNLYDAKTFQKIGQRSLNYEGWGLTNNGKELIASDGSTHVYFYEPGTFRLLRSQQVMENGS